MSRKLYLIAYDVGNPKRLNFVCKFLTGYKVSGQKSVFEIWVTKSELLNIHQMLEKILDIKEDRLNIFALDPRMASMCFGKAESFTKNYFTII